MAKLRTILLLLLPTLLFSQKLAQNYELFASKIVQREKSIEAFGDVVIYNGENYFGARRAIYDTKTKTVELFGDVIYLRDNREFTRAEYLKIDLTQKHYLLKSPFLFDLSSHIWLYSRSFRSYEDRIKFSKTTLSSCDVVDPDWRIGFSQGYYYKKSEFVTLYNPTFYIGNVPILYLPWFGFPTTKKRKSGLLRPVIGFENAENIFYQQPIFYAPAKNWDLQFDPQIRFNRGLGLYTTLRFVDTSHSKGHIRVGGFREKSSYAASHRLNNRTHSGAEFYYRRNGLLEDWLKRGDFHDGLLVDITQLSDIDYLNLKRYNNFSLNKLVTSKINYFINRKDDYLGLYAKYFIDTEKLNNDDTMQTLPSIQYHRFVKNLPFRNLYYSLDYKYKNNYRKKGLRASQHEIAIPLSLRFDFFHNYLSFFVTENLYYSHAHYNEANDTISDANHLSNYHVFRLNSDLIKKYPETIHNMQIELSYIVPSFDHKKGYFADFIPFNYERKSLRFVFNEYFYSLNGFDYLTHRLKQILYLDHEKNVWEDLQNELIYRFRNDFWIQNTLFYAHHKHKISKLQTALHYENDNYKVHMNHTYQSEAFGSEANFLTADLYAKLSGHYTLYGGIDYDFQDGFTKEWRLGWDMRKRCWNYTLRYKESITPSLTSAGAESTTRRGVYLILRLYPIGGVSYSYVNESKEEQGVL